jgi:nitrogen fixation NifU-like protein
VDFKDGEESLEKLDQAILQELGDDINENVLDHVLRPRNAGVMEDPDGEAALSGICEDMVRIQIRLSGDRIADIRFMTNGCAATIACASVATDLALGKALQEVLRIRTIHILEALGGLPVEYTHCADLTANTLRAAVRDAVGMPW